MRLWTFHPPDFSLVAGCVDHARSMYADDETIMDAYRKLWARIGAPTGQVIWCCTSRDDWWVWQETSCWELEVPDDRILALVDEITWTRIIRPGDIICERLWWNEYQGDLYQRDEYMERRRQEFRAKKPPGGSWWNALFVERDQARPEMTSALIPHPIADDWCIECKVLRPR